jgi:hypothetical protein
LPAIVAGLVIGIYEILLVHRDVTIPTHRFGHALHAVFIAIIAELAVFNVPFVFGIFPQLASIPYVGSVWGFRIIIGLIMMAKIHGVSAALKNVGMATHGMRETWFHSLIVAVLVVIAPYAWPFLAPYLPNWAGGATPVKK